MIEEGVPTPVNEAKQFILAVAEVGADFVDRPGSAFIP
jgi:hypothetical protein